MIGPAARWLSALLLLGSVGQQAATARPPEFAGADPAALVAGKRVFLYPTGGEGRLHS